MAAVNTISRDLGLRSSNLVVLDALLSCLPLKDPKTKQEMLITPLTLLTVYASNDTLCFRAKGLTDRQLRRHFDRLEEMGLIRRRDSANGKRFPVQRQGKVIGAFGIDLSPLLERSSEFLRLAAVKRQEAEELRGLKSQINRARVECMSAPLNEEDLGFVEMTRNLMRRMSTTLVQARALLADLMTLLNRARGQSPAEGTAAPCPTPARPDEVDTAALAPYPSEDIANIEADDEIDTGDQTENTPATDGKNVRHKEPKDSYTKKINPISFNDLWACLPNVSSFYPSVPRSMTDLRRIAYEFGMMLRIDQATLARAIQTLGWSEAMEQIDTIASKAHVINHPDAYLKGILKSGRLHNSTQEA